MKKLWLFSVVLLVSFILPITAGAQTHYPGEVRRTIYLQSSLTRVSSTQPLVLQCYIDPYDHLGCDTFCFYIIVRSVIGSNTVTVACNGQLARTFQVPAGQWSSSALGDWASYLHPGWNIIKIEDKTRGSIAEVGGIKIDLTPATWHDGIGQYDPPGVQLRILRGAIHLHTKDSDGSWTLEQYVAEGKKRGWSFIIPTDHNPTASEQWAKLQRCNQLSISGQFSVIPGAELSTTWKPSSITKSYSHTLALYYFGDRFMEQLQGKPDYQQYLNRYANACSTLAIAAHPYLTSDALFRYDFRTVLATFMTKGVECFNSLTASQEEDTFKKILEFVRNRQLCIVTSGSDYHTPFDPKGEERLQRLTEVFATENTWVGITRSLIYGRTCATAKQAYLEWASYLPYARSSYVAVTPNLVFDIRFAGKLNTTVTYELYRDGGSSPIARISKRVNGTNLLVRFETKDSGASKGEHWYIMRVKGYIVTSPIIITRY